LPYAHRLRLERFDPPARTSSLAGLALAVTAAARTLGDAFGGVADLRMREDEKPRFARGPHFSISHSRARVACVVCVPVEVGLDVESGPSGPDLASTRKLLHWTATEATLKAAGAGLRRLADVRVDLEFLEAVFDGRRYVLRELLLAPDTLGHVASLRPIDLELEHVELDGSGFSASLERVLGLTPQRQQ